jgi:hypothetical protein
MSQTPRACTVQFRTCAGAWVHVTPGASVFHAAARALEYFASDHWHGPRPGPETFLEVGTDRRRAGVAGAVAGRVRNSGTVSSA